MSDKVTLKHQIRASKIIDKHFVEYSSNAHVIAHLAETLAHQEEGAAETPPKEKAYRIKPLVWEGENKFGAINALNEIGERYAVSKTSIGWQSFTTRLGWQNCDSLEDGKHTCEVNYRAFIETALEEVEFNLGRELLSLAVAERDKAESERDRLRQALKNLYDHPEYVTAQEDAGKLLEEIK